MISRRWVWLSGLLLTAALLVGGCLGGQQSKRPDVDFAPLAFDAAPDELRQYYEETKAIPGLFVLHKGEQTYLLVTAGTAPEAEMAVEVIEIRRDGKRWRVLATLERASGGSDYPFAVVQIKAPQDAVFLGRLTGPDGEIRELRGMTISDR